jgi:nicotinamidase/pyrazinamidase
VTTAEETRTVLEPQSRESARRKSGDVLLVVDVQNDFLPGGALAVPAGDGVIAPLNRCAAAFDRDGLPIFATRDWHPADHCSFRARGGPWPTHCVVGTIGAELPASLVLPRNAKLVPKGTRPDTEAYSGFQGTDLAKRMKAVTCTRVFIGGLATDYCVRATALDARSLGLDVFVIEDAVRAVNLHPGDGERALREMSSSGVHFCSAEDLAT